MTVDGLVAIAIMAVAAILTVLAKTVLAGSKSEQDPTEDGPSDPVGRDTQPIAGDYLSDKPLEDPAADRFGRMRFAERVAETVSARGGSASLVIGIYGRWGSGKTTVLNFINRSLSTHEDLLVESFNPWLFSSTEQLLRPDSRDAGDEAEHSARVARKDTQHLRQRGLHRKHTHGARS
jgi:KAP family P-loop domain